MKYLLNYLITIFILLFASLTSYAQKDSITGKEVMHYELKGITVKGNIPQIIQSKDTAIINPSAYHTPQDAYLKDLVKRIPGLEYDEKNGTLTFNGKRIREVNVNGKPFFSGNTQVPLENLPLKFVSRLKIYKKQNDEEKALGIRTGKEFHVLDLITKKAMDKTFMNSAVIGAGTENKKQYELHSDYFESGGNNLSFHATSGNRYSTDTYKGSTNNALSLNATRQFGKKLTLTGSFQYSRDKSGSESATYMEQYLKDDNNYALSQNTGRQQSRSFSAYTNLNWEMDKRTQFTLSASYNRTNSHNSSENINASSAIPLTDVDIRQPFTSYPLLPDSLKINRNQSSSTGSSRNDGYTFNAAFIRRLGHKGTLLSLNLQNNYNHNQSDETTENATNFYRIPSHAGGDSLLVQNLLRQSPVSSRSLQSGLSLVQPIGKRWKLQLAYTYRNDLDKSTNATFSNPLYQKNYVYVDSLSGNSSSHTIAHDFRLTVNYTSDIWNMYLNTDLLPGRRSIYRRLSGATADTLTHITDFRSSLHIERTKHNRTLTFDYNTSSMQPDLNSLVPLTDKSDPLNVYRGNPDLKPTYNHTWSLSYNAFTKGLAFNLGYNLTQNALTQATRYDARTGGRETYPVNVNGNWSLNSYLRWWKTLGKFNLSAMGSGSYNRTVSLLSESEALQRNATRNIYVNTGMQAGYSPSWGGINLSGNYTYYYTANSLRTNGNYTHSLSSSLNVFTDLPFGLSLQTDFMLTLRNGPELSSSEKSQTLWNASATYRFLKEKRMEVALTWHDILNHSRLYYRTSTDTGFYASYSPQIRSYIMLTLKYRFQITK